MVSDFLVAHPSGPFFSLSQEEFDFAAKQYLLASEMNHTDAKRRLRCAF